MRKAYSMLDIKAVDDKDRIIKGVASTVSPDRVDDVVEPGGAQFKLPLPLLSQHDHQLPIGDILEAEVKSDRIEIVGQVKKDTELEYIETAWKQIRAKLVRGLSIGFRILEYAFIKDSYGIHIKEWEWLELSSVTIPANAECTITSVKAFDSDPAKRLEAIRATSGINPRVEKALERIEASKRLLNK
jgi:HK97 family phage prohead protease